MALTADPADQALLLELQERDTAIARITARLERLPETAAVAALRTRLTALGRELAEAVGRLEDATAELRRTEEDVTVVDARVARDQELLLHSASVKDIQGFERELLSLARRKSELEEIELVAMEVVETAQSLVDSLRADAARLETELAETAAAEQLARAGAGEELRYTEISRNALAGRIPADLLDLYERQRSRYGIGASLLRGGVSTASGVALTGSDLSAVRTAAPDAVLLCPDSNAILVRTAESGI